MRVAVFSTKSYDKEHFHQANAQYGFDLEFFDVRLEAKTARLAHGFPWSACSSTMMPTAKC